MEHRPAVERRQVVAVGLARYPVASVAE